jgi:hypothetical protein
MRNGACPEQYASTFFRVKNLGTLCSSSSSVVTCRSLVGLDANATSIEVRIDIASHNIQVSDNGVGITSVDMGLIGTRYATSKCSTLRDLRRITTFGFRGEGMSSYNRTLSHPT